MIRPTLSVEITMTLVASASPSVDGLIGKRVLLTGGTKGIGAAVVARLVQSGAEVVTVARSVAPSKVLSPCRTVACDVSTAG